MFYTETPNRRMNSKELETEKWIANLFNRPMRYFVKDTPYYPYLPKKPVNEPHVTFDLNFTE